MWVARPSMEANQAARIGALSIAATVALAVMGLFVTAREERALRMGRSRT